MKKWAFRSKRPRSCDNAKLSYINKGYIHGKQVYMILSFLLLYLFIFFTAIKQMVFPSGAPTNFQLVQDVLNQQGVSGLGNYYALEDFPWYLAHVTGVIFIILSIKLILYSLLNIIFVTRDNYLRGGKSSAWTIKTSSYKPSGMLFIAILSFSLLGYYLISGIGLSWIENDCPVLLEKLMNIVIYGKG